MSESPTSGLSIGLVIGILAALWSANQGAKAMFTALNDVYGEREKRSYIQRTFLSLSFTIGGIVFLLATLFAVIVLPLMFAATGVSCSLYVIVQLVRWPLSVIVIMFGLALLYRFGRAVGLRNGGG